jgi:hypothetical protein
VLRDLDLTVRPVRGWQVHSGAARRPARRPRRGHGTPRRDGPARAHEGVPPRIRGVRLRTSRACR